MKRIYLLVAFGLLSATVFSQTVDTRSQFNYNIVKTQDKIILDGDVNDPAWLAAEEIENFYNHWPIDSGMAKNVTKVKVTYDDNFIYVAATCYDNGSRVIQSLKRDSDKHWRSDAFSIAFDPINVRTNGVFFGVNAGGAQIEGTLNARGNFTNNDTNWDNKWYSEVKAYDNYWTVEIAIPFKTFRYNNTNPTWGINFLRNDMENNMYSTWTQFPLNFGGLELNYTGHLSWDNPPAIAKGKVVLIPYAAGGISKDHEAGENTAYDANAGLDAKIALTSSLNLDLTVNPDFSNVDVDQQQTNLSRFSLFFPEKRNFFLENSDLFSDFGAWHTRPFFSRKIGLIDGEPIPILYGARISGNLTNKLRIGVMSVQTRETEDVSAQNYAVGSVQYKVLAKSNVKVIFANRQATGTTNPESPDAYNRLGGAEFRYASKDGKLGGSLQYHYTNTPENYKDSDYYLGEVFYETKKMFAGYQYSKVGENFISDMGFTPRLNNYDPVQDTVVRIGYQMHNPWIGFNFYPKNSEKVNQHGPRFWNIFTLNPDGSLNERVSNLVYSANFKNQSRTRFIIRNTEVNLPYSLGLIDAENPLPATNYNYTEVRLRYSSDARKVFSYNAEVSYGGFYNGSKLTVRGEANFRQQPWGNFGVAYTGNSVDLPSPYGSTVLHLIGPKTEISFSNKMFWTTFLQYNTQAENFNINSRFQWRYKPMSDIFLVYTDNYATTDLGVKNRGFVFKITYWLNI